MLIETIRARAAAAMKNRDSLATSILRLALGEIQTVEARSGKPPTDDESAAVIRKIIKSNQETIEATVDAEQKLTLDREIAILSDLLPRSLSVPEIVAALEPMLEQIRAAKADGQATGAAMKHLKQLGATVSGSDVTQAVKLLRGA